MARRGRKKDKKTVLKRKRNGQEKWEKPSRSRKPMREQNSVAMGKR